MGKGKELPPDPEPFDGALPTTKPQDKHLPLCVDAGDHLAD